MSELKKLIGSMKFKHKKEAFYIPEHRQIQIIKDFDSLEARVSELEKANEWIKIDYRKKETLPEQGKKVLVYVRGDVHTDAIYIENETMWSIASFIESEQAPTHWQPITITPPSNTKHIHNFDKFIRNYNQYECACGLLTDAITPPKE
jgi:hypothetical protein